ncbi:MAG: polysaccharide deacetylase family protein [Vicinamibacterales bacterium]
MRTPGRAVVLMYHRVAAPLADPWALSVTPAAFDDQMAMLRAEMHPLSLTELGAAVRGGHVPERAVAVTFDDGYADTASLAWPRLRVHGVPATVFLATGYVGGRTEFWWDFVARVFLEPGPRPSHLALTVGGRRHSWTLGARPGGGVVDGRAPWRADDPPATPWQAAYREVWGLLQQCGEEERRDRLAELALWAAEPTPGASDCVAMTAGDVGTLACDPLIAFGAHSVTHPPLASLPVEEQRREIRESIAAVRALGTGPVTSFSYPYGSHSDDTVAAVADAGMAVACTTAPGAVEASTPLLRVPRLQVLDWDGRTLRDRLAAVLDAR